MAISLVELISGACYYITFLSFTTFETSLNHLAASVKDQNQKDLTLISKYQETNNTEFVRALIEKYSAQILAFGYRHLRNESDTKDFASDVFLKLCEKLKKEQILHFKSWLYTFMKNFFYDQKRKEQLHIKYLNNRDKKELYEIENQIIKRLDQKLLYEALHQLPEKEKRCITYLYLESKNYSEIIKETNWTFNQIRGTRERAIKKLRILLSEEFRESS